MLLNLNIAGAFTDLAIVNGLCLVLAKSLKRWLGFFNDFIFHILIFLN